MSRFFQVWCIDDHEKYHIMVDKITAIRETHVRLSGAGSIVKPDKVDAKGDACRVIHAGDLEVYTTWSVEDIIEKIEKCLT